MTLLDTQKGKWYQVKRIIEREKVQRRLEALGILEGTRVQVLNQKKKRLYDHPCAGNPLGLRTGYRRRY